MKDKTNLTIIANLSAAQVCRIMAILQDKPEEEPLAPEGSPEWAWQQMLLGKMITVDCNFVYRIFNGFVEEACMFEGGSWHDFQRMRADDKAFFLRGAHKGPWWVYHDSLLDTPAEPLPETSRI